MAGLNQFNPRQLTTGGQRTDEEFLRFLDELDRRLGRERILPGPELGAQLQGGRGGDFGRGDFGRGPDFGGEAPSIAPRSFPDEIPLGSQLDIQDPLGALGGAAQGAGGGFLSKLKGSATSPLGVATIVGNLASTDFEDPASIGQSVGGTAGGLIGNALFPGVGGFIGNAAGQFLGGEVGGLFGDSPEEEAEEDEKKRRKRTQTQDSLRNAAIFFAQSNARRGIPQFF